jgi:hypothetical protein
LKEVIPKLLLLHDALSIAYQLLPGSDHEREMLYNLVVNAIEAKKPDAVLCMGEVSMPVS